MIKVIKTDTIVLLVTMLLVGITAIILGKDTHWDLKHYHYYNGYAFLYGRLDYDIAPADIQTYLNPLMDIPVYLGITYLPAKLFGFLLGAIQGIGIWLVYKLTRSVMKESSQKNSVALAILSSITAFLGVGWLSEIGATMGDNIVALFILSALLLTISCPAPITFSNGKRALIGASFLLGFGTGLKLIAGSYLIGYLFSLALVMDKHLRMRNYIVVIIAASSGILASIGFWIVKLWYKFQSPLFPFYNEIFQSPYFDIANWKDNRFSTNNLLESLFYPIFFTFDPQRVCELVFLDFRLLTLYLVVLLYSFWFVAQRFLGWNKLSISAGYNKSKEHFLVAFCMISYMLWLIVYPYYRYAIPLEILTPVIVVIVLGSLGMSSLVSRRITYLILILLIVIGLTKPINWGRHPWESGPPWDDSAYFSVISSGPLTRYENSTILMGDDAVSYVIPFFPEQAKFIHTLGDGINLYRNSNYKNPKMISEIKKEISQSKNLKIMISNESEMKDTAIIFNVRVNLYACDSFLTSVGDRFFICDAAVI